MATANKLPEKTVVDSCRKCESLAESWNRIDAADRVHHEGRCKSLGKTVDLDGMPECMGREKASMKTTADEPDVALQQEQGDKTLLLPADQVATMCSMHRASWYKAVASGKAPASVRIGGMVRWRRDEIEAWIAAGCPPRSKWEATLNAPVSKQRKRG